MKIGLKFGSAPTESIEWDKAISDFPHLVMYNSKKWEFVAYDEDPANVYDHVFYFGEVKTYDPNWYATTYVDMDLMFFFHAPSVPCECGAKHTSFPQIHMSFCPLWRKI